MIWLSVARSPAPVAGKIGPAQTLSAPVLVEKQPASREQVGDVGGEVLYRSYMLYTRQVPVPDIRVKDILTDPLDVDPLTNAPATYIVRGVQAWPGHHLEILAERQAGA